MCEYCHSYPHKAGCPNEPEPKEVYICKHCKEGIQEGEEFVRIGEDFYHLECLEGLGIKEVLELAEIDVKTAEVD